MRTIPHSEWQWFGMAGHLIVAQWCRFHLCTQVGEYRISTVGEYVPEAGVRELLATTRGIELEGQGDARLADWLNKQGFEDIGFNRKYETMVFRATGKPCDSETCNCGLPEVSDYTELDGDGYNDAGSANRGHMAMCQKWAEHG